MNRSNFIHAAAAVALQISLGALPYAIGVDWALWASGAFAVGFFVGVEWMQELRVQNPQWPQTKTTPLGAMKAFTGWSRDRYWDFGAGLILCGIVAFITERVA